MSIICPKCDQEHNIDLAKIPHVKFNAICKTCRFKFLVKTMNCPACDTRQLEAETCSNCGAPLQVQAAEDTLQLEITEEPAEPVESEPAAAAEPELENTRQQEEKSEEAKPSPPPAQPQRFKPEFTGNPGEFFRIWIVNLFLTIATLGIYAAWAKVRTRKYFYANTRLDGHAFDYTADPKAILRGNLIIAGGFLLYTLGGNYSPILALVAIVLFGAVFPFLIYKSLRFFARNSLFRNIRFRFLGSLSDSYKTYLLYPILIPFSMGFFMPYWAYWQKKYFFGNMAFGSSSNAFDGGARTFYRVYAMALLFMAAPMLLVFGMTFFLPRMNLTTTSFMQAAGTSKIGFAAVFMMFYVGMLVAMTFIQQYLFANLTNYCWEVSQLGKVRFESTLKVKSLLWIRITNILAMVFSLGLLTPWAKIRRARYVVDNLTVCASQDLDSFMAVNEPDESAIGEAATDFFDFEVGL